MPRAVLVEHHADAGLALAPAAVGAAPLRLGDQACALQGGLGPGVAPGEAVVGAQMVVEVLDRPAHVAGAVLLEHPGHLIGRHAARGRFAEPAVEEAVQAFLLIASSVAVEAALAHPQKLRRLQGGKPPCLKVSQNILKGLHPAFL